MTQKKYTNFEEDSFTAVFFFLSENPNKAGKRVFIMKACERKAVK